MSLTPAYKNRLLVEALELQASAWEESGSPAHARSPEHAEACQVTAKYLYALAEFERQEGSSPHLIAQALTPGSQQRYLTALEHYSKMSELDQQYARARHVENVIEEFHHGIEKSGKFNAREK